METLFVTFRHIPLISSVLTNIFGSLVFIVLTSFGNVVKISWIILTSFGNTSYCVPPNHLGIVQNVQDPHFDFFAFGNSICGVTLLPHDSCFGQWIIFLTSKIWIKWFYLHSWYVFGWALAISTLFFTLNVIHNLDNSRQTTTIINLLLSLIKYNWL